MTALNDAELAIFAIFSFPALYCLITHGKPGILGWLYVTLFCIVRVVGNALLIYDESKGHISTAAEVVSSLGLSPLLLSVAGILHEGRRARAPRTNGKWEWVFVLQYHCLVTVGIVLIVSRASDLASGNRKAIDQTLIDVGMAILDVSWVVLIAWTLFSFWPQQKPGYGPVATRFEHGTKLLFAVLLALPLLGVRVVYSTTAYIINSATLTNSLAIKVCLGTLPEMLIIAIVLVVGVWTRDMGRLRSRSNKETF